MSDREQKANEGTKKTPWFRFHLSTAVVITILAGIVLGLNILSPQIDGDQPKDEGVSSKGTWGGQPFEYDRKGGMNRIMAVGWPAEFYCKEEFRGQIYTDKNPTSSFLVGDYTPRKKFNVSYLALDVACLIVILLAATIFCEFLNRRRKIHRAV